ncbi:MAG: UDP-N-acetylglucosamine 2-epimerase [Parvibaculaceae bacterium]
MSTKTRSVMFVTGSRAEYDILFPVIEAVSAVPELEPEIVVTGSHFARQFGLTVRDVEADGFPIVAKIDSLLASDSAAARAKSAAIQLQSLVDVAAHRDPDFLVVVGDREEAITTAMTGAYLDVPVVHIAGGDTADDFNVDNSVRHAVTKLAHLHMTASAGSAERVRKLGEEDWRVHQVGAPGLDRLVSEPVLAPACLWTKLGVRPVDGPYAVMIQHPLLPEMDQAEDQIRATLDALVASGLPAFISGPNSDPGNQGMAALIDAYTAKHEQLVAYKNLSRPLYVNLIRHAAALVGNSSSGIIEAPLLKLPVVNVGSRQVGREHGGNVQFVGYDSAAIGKALHRAVFDEDYRAEVARADNPYGDGTAGRKICDILMKETDRRRLLEKRNTF